MVQDSLDGFMRAKHATLLALRLDTKWTASQEEHERLWKLYIAGLPHGAFPPSFRNQGHMLL